MIKGQLHRDMGIPPGHKIPIAQLMKKKAKDKREGNTVGLKRDVFALNVKRK